MSATSAERTVTLHGHVFSYTDSGSGPALLFIHGILGSQKQWGHLVDRLDDNHRLIVPDLFGHGESAKPVGDYSLGAHAATLRDLLDKLGIAAGHPGRALAGRRHRDGLLLPLPRAGRPARARRERRARPRGQPAAALGHPARCRVRAAGHRVGVDARPDLLCRKAVRDGRAAARPRPHRGLGRLHLARRRRHPPRLPGHHPGGHRPGRPERQRARLPARRHAHPDAGGVGHQGPDDPGVARGIRDRLDAELPGRAVPGRRALPAPRRPRPVRRAGARVRRANRPERRGADAPTRQEIWSQSSQPLCSTSQAISP